MKKINKINLMLILMLFFIGISTIKSNAQCNDTSKLNISTGISTTGALLPTTGVVDPYWQLTNVAPPSADLSGGINIPNAYTIPVAFGTWCAIAGSVPLNVIPSATFSTNNQNAAQPWRFKRKFSVIGSGTLIIGGHFIGDDRARLNICSPTGTVLRTHLSIGGHSTKDAFNDTLQVTTGCYYMEIELENIGAGLMGFAVGANIACIGNVSVANPSQTCCATSMITGQKWIDKDCDGKIGITDLPGVGWTFQLKNGSTVLQTSTTDANGEFFFNNLSAGTYTVAEINQTGYAPSFPIGGSTTATIVGSNQVEVLQFLNCKDSTPPGNCAQIIDPIIICDSWQYKMQFSIKNLSTWDMKGITIHNLNPNVQAVSTVSNGGDPFYDIIDIYTGATSSVITVPLYVPNYDSTACFNFTFCDFNVPGAPHLNCCTVDSICLDVEKCQGTGTVGSGCTNPCDGLTEIEWKFADSTKTDCCFKLSFKNDYIAANIGKIIFQGIGGTEFSVTATTGWTYGGINTATYRELIAPAGGYGIGYYADFIQMCITSSNPAPHKVLVQYVDVNGVCMCLDTLQFEQCKVVEPHCATIINDSIYCENNKTMYSFYIKNDAGFPIRQMDYFISDTSHFILTPNQLQLGPTDSIKVGETKGPFKVEIDTTNGGASQFCFQVSAFNNAYTQNSYATQCCSDAIRQICLPFIQCKIDGCCEFDKIKIPNGITPNNDKINDTWVITKPAECDSISITVFNRWGNIVYKDTNYLNNWSGTNQSGTLLPQSTYFVVIELKNGSKKGLYVDVRY